ncbi:helix-turn-helix domain-containing protein [Psychrobacillus sp. NPDC096623]|uniref:helix-turn-helix domain-containing protein n=1 Tax=Psychrobacillus sp. NPDC096623 TaxID=3364492 RepID=UPI00381286C1
MEDIVKIVGEKIRNFRKERGLSQEELAHQASLHNTYIGQLERGEKNATIESLYKITNALGITLEELFSNTQTGPKANSIEITKIITLLEDRSSNDQRTILSFIELLINWKGNN